LRVDPDDLMEDLGGAALHVVEAEVSLRGQIALNFMQARKRPRIGMSWSWAWAQAEAELCQQVRCFQRANLALKRARGGEDFSALRREALDKALGEGWISLGILDFLKARSDEDVSDIADAHRNPAERT
jgi:hypothetical protein